MGAISNLLLPGMGAHCDTLRKILGLSAALIICMLYLPICCYGAYRYYEHKRFVFMRKRYQWLTTFMIINLVLSLIFLPIILLVYSNYLAIDGWIDFLFYAVIVLATNNGWKMTWRLFMHFFDTKWANSIANKEWKTLINTSSSDQQTDWFIAKRSTFGKWQFFATPYFVVVVVDFLLLTQWEYVPVPVDSKPVLLMVTISAIAAAPISMITYLRFKTPAFDDGFAVRDETKFVLCSVCGGVAVIAAISCISRIPEH